MDGFAIPGGWLANKWSREAMMVVFFVGIGPCSAFAGLADNPVQISLSLTLVGLYFYDLSSCWVDHGCRGAH